MAWRNGKIYSSKIKVCWIVEEVGRERNRERARERVRGTGKHPLDPWAAGKNPLLSSTEKESYVVFPSRWTTGHLTKPLTLQALQRVTQREQAKRSHADSDRKCTQRSIDRSPRFKHGHSLMQRHGCGDPRTDQANFLQVRGTENMRGQIMKLSWKIKGTFIAHLSEVSNVYLSPVGRNRP